MNFGVDDLQRIIASQLAQGNANVTGGRSKFAKDLAKRIYEFVESKDMNRNMKTEAFARGVSAEDLAMSDRVGDALGFDVMPLTPEACRVYQWIASQEAKGQKIETFAAWAKSIEQLKFITMYRKDVSNIKLKWPLAFNSTSAILPDHNDGSIHA
jgi:hypothetical protein